MASETRKCVQWKIRLEKRRGVSLYKFVTIIFYLILFLEKVNGVSLVNSCKKKSNCWTPSSLFIIV